jgi:hypothetical protein
LSNFITHPEVSHLHGAQLLAFDGAVCNTNSHHIVTVYLCSGLWVAKVF